MYFDASPPFIRSLLVPIRFVSQSVLQDYYTRCLVAIARFFFLLKAQISVIKSRRRLGLMSSPSMFRYNTPSFIRVRRDLHALFLVATISRVVDTLMGHSGRRVDQWLTFTHIQLQVCSFIIIINYTFLVISFTCGYIITYTAISSIFLLLLTLI